MHAKIITKRCGLALAVLMMLSPVIIIIWAAIKQGIEVLLSY